MNYLEDVGGRWSIEVVEAGRSLEVTCAVKSKVAPIRLGREDRESGTWLTVEVKVYLSK